MVFTREFWAGWAGWRAGQTALCAGIALSPLSLYYTQVRLGPAVVIAGIAGVLSLTTSVASAGVAHRDGTQRIEQAILAGMQTSLATALVGVLGLMSAPWLLVTLGGVVAGLIAAFWRQRRPLPSSSEQAAETSWATPESIVPLMNHSATTNALRDLADQVVEQPQVRAAGLNPQELARLRHEVLATVEQQAGDIARATSSYYGQYQTAKARYIRHVGVPVLARGHTVFRWAGWYLLWLALAAALQPVLRPVLDPAALSYGVLVATPLAFAAGGFRRRRWSSRLALNTAMATVVAGVIALLASLWLTGPSARYVVIGSVLAAIVAFALWRWAHSWWATALRLFSDNDEDWPHDDSPARREAVQSRREWINAVYEVGVVPILSSKIDTFAARSYDTALPDASVTKLGDITELTQFVPTETSRQLTRMLASMPTAAIGLSGPRGVGKSTVLRVLGDDRFRANANDRGLIVSAPTSYDSREFLVHLFAKLCEIVVPDTRAVLRRRWPWLLTLTGAVVVGVAVGWPWLVEAVRWVRANPRTAVVVAGTALLVVGAVGYLRSGRLPEDASIEDLARQHLRTLRYLETRTVTHTGLAKLPIGADLGRQQARQRAEIAKSYPELVGDFREFLNQVGLSLRTRDPRSRVVICIDELDKIGSPEAAEQFLNDVKAIFRVPGSYFLVTVSEDAMTSFSRRALAVRTTFDTAFDAVVQVGRFSLTDTRALLVQQVIRLPEPFVWFCHCLSGGLPRDLGRTVRSLYDVRSAHEVGDLAELARRLVTADVASVAHGQLLRASGHSDPSSGAVLRWIAAIKDLPIDGLIQHAGTALTAVYSEVDSEQRLLVNQCRAHLYYAATVHTAFGDQLAATIEHLRGAEADVEHLARARAELSVDPVLSWRAVDDFRTAAPGLAKIRAPF